MKGLFSLCCDCCRKKEKNYIKNKNEAIKSSIMVQDSIKYTSLVEKGTQKESKVLETEERKLLQVRNPIKSNKKQIERINITGAVAALPPPPIEEIEGEIPKVNDSYDDLNLGKGVYLIYSLEGNGSIYLQYTYKKPSCMDGVLAYIRPNREVLNYHYENNNGKNVISTNVRDYMKSKFQQDRKKYFDAWQEFFQILNSYGGSLYILSAFNLSPPPRIKIVLFSQNNLKELSTCKEIKIKESDLVGVFPSSLDYKSKLIKGINRNDFCEMCKKYGFVFQIIK